MNEKITGMLLDLGNKAITERDIAEYRLSNIKNFCSKTDDELRLMCGELSAQELRAVRAVLDVIKGML